MPLWNTNSNGLALSNLIHRTINGQVVVGRDDDGRDGSRWGFIVRTIIVAIRRIIISSFIVK